MNPAPSRGRLVVATANPGKLREIRAILGELPVEVVGLEGLPQVAFPEEGDDYDANARAKARAAAAALGLPALADDSGLEVEALGGRPGVRSARYGGDDAGRVARLLRELAGREPGQRRARFVCVAALAWPDGRATSARGECAGRIREAPAGGGGFGYDPLFEPDGYDRTLAELPAAEKNRISHRARALARLRPALVGLDTGTG